MEAILDVHDSGERVMGWCNYLEDLYDKLIQGACRSARAVSSS